MEAIRWLEHVRVDALLPRLQLNNRQPVNIHAPTVTGWMGRSASPESERKDFGLCAPEVHKSCNAVSHNPDPSLSVGNVETGR